MSRPRPKLSRAAIATTRLAVYRAASFSCTRCGWAPAVPEGYDGTTALWEWRGVGAKATVRILELDHIYPHLHGGRFEVDNLQALCNVCNSSKGAKV